MGKYTAKNKKFTIFSLKSIEKNVEIYYNIDRNKTGGGVMDFKAEQDRLDKIKWDDSMREGRDKCGTYDFCACCKKEAQYPCARAAYRYRNGYVRIAILRARE